MSNRVTELAIETDIWCDKNVAQDAPWYNAMWEHKFAELIVRECAKVAFNDWCEGTNEESSQMAILKHFGIKE
jgi:hypothetical protein